MTATYWVEMLSKQCAAAGYLHNTEATKSAHRPAPLTQKSVWRAADGRWRTVAPPHTWADQVGRSSTRCCQPQWICAHCEATVTFVCFAPRNNNFTNRKRWAVSAVLTHTHTHTSIPSMYLPQLLFPAHVIGGRLVLCQPHVQLVSYGLCNVFGYRHQQPHQTACVLHNLALQYLCLVACHSGW